MVSPFGADSKQGLGADSQVISFIFPLFQYKIHADTHRRHAEFQVGDYVMIRIQAERFPSGPVKKLQARSAGPFKVLKRIGPNAYVIDLPHDYGISSSFNIENLVAYKTPQLFLIPF